MTAVEEIGVNVGGLSEAFRSMVSVGADESKDESVSQLSRTGDRSEPVCRYTGRSGRSYE